MAVWAKEAVYVEDQIATFVHSHVSHQEKKKVLQELVRKLTNDINALEDESVCESPRATGPEDYPSELYAVFDHARHGTALTFPTWKAALVCGPLCHTNFRTCHNASTYNVKAGCETLLVACVHTRNFLQS